MKIRIASPTIVRSGCILLALLVSLGSVRTTIAGVCSAPPTFAEARTFGTGGVPAFVAVADFNGDGKSDLAAATREGVSVLLGNGDGNFQTAVNYGAGTNPVFVASADFNDDNRLDLVVVNQGQTNGADGTVSVLAGNGDGTFQAAVNYSAGLRPHGVTVGDFNGDGKPDLAVANEGVLQGNGNPFVTFSNSSVSVLLSKGDGTFQTAVDYYAGGGASSVGVADFNGDGRLDLAVSKQGAPQDDFNHADFSILPGKGDGTFQPLTTLDQYSLNPGSRPLAIGDFNADGKPDLAVASGAGYRIAVVLSKGDGAFNEPISNQTVWTPSSAAVGDFDNDGILDLVVGGAYGNISLLVGNGAGTFYSLPLTLNGASKISGVAVSDFNGDGKPDLVVADAASTNLWILLNAGLSTLPTPNFEQIATIVTGGFAASVLVGDFNGDGKLDLAVPNGEDAVAILLGGGGGTFQDPVRYHVANRPGSVGAGHFNGDGNLDLAVGAQGGVSTLLGKGDGTFHAATNYGAGLSPMAVAVADFNGDLKPDLVVANYGNSVSDFGDVSMLLGKGDGTFESAVNYRAGLSPAGMAVGDFDGDGRPDLAVANYNGDDANGAGLSVLLGKGDGKFQTAVPYDTGGGAGSVAAGDWNGDGRLDLAVATWRGQIKVLLGKGDGNFQEPAGYGALPGSSIAAGDLNGDGKMDLAVVGGSGLSVLLGNGDGTFQPSVGSDVPRVSGIATGDFNGDGKPDLVTVDDRLLLSAIVSVWMNACGSAGPGLNIARDGANISISWPSAMTGASSPSRQYVLEFTTRLTPANWKPADIVPASSNGRWEVSTPVTQAQGYFRLRKP